MSFLSDLVDKFRPAPKLAGSQMQLIVVTGSVGKTSVASLVHHLLFRGGFRVALISTRGVWVNDQESELGGESFSVNNAKSKEVHSLIHKFAFSDIQFCIVEAPASRLAQGLLKGMSIDAAILTNIIDNPDLRGDFKSHELYSDAMFQMIAQVKEQGIAVLNGEDASASWVAQKAQRLPQNIYAGFCKTSDASDVKMDLNGTKFSFQGQAYEALLLTKIGLINLLQAISLCSRFVSAEQIRFALSIYYGVPGRLHKMPLPDKIVIVDYAYQDTVAERVLQSIRELIPDTARIITITGAAGRKGPNRVLVGEPVVRLSQIAIFCAQDPRDEHVSEINNKLVAVTEKAHGVVVDRFTSHEEYGSIDKRNLMDKVQRVTQNSDKPILVFDMQTPSSRYDAIDFALRYATPADIILVLGKGDDEVMDFGDALYEWNDYKMTNEVYYELAGGYRVTNSGSTPV